MVSCLPLDSYVLLGRRSAIRKIFATEKVPAIRGISAVGKISTIGKIPAKLRKMLE